MKTFLVEIVFCKNVFPTPPDSGLIELYEIQAEDVYAARQTALRLFKSELIHNKRLRSFLNQWKMPYESMWHVGTAVEI